MAFQFYLSRGWFFALAGKYIYILKSIILNLNVEFIDIYQIVILDLLYYIQLFAILYHVSLNAFSMILWYYPIMEKKGRIKIIIEYNAKSSIQLSRTKARPFSNYQSISLEGVRLKRWARFQWPARMQGIKVKSPSCKTSSPDVRSDTTSPFNVKDSQEPESKTRVNITTDDFRSRAQYLLFSNIPLGLV